jgi:hypothetical protein
MGKHTSTWKHCEREVAKLLGGQRIGITGRNDDSMPDVITPKYAVECKHGAKYSATWFHELTLGQWISSTSGHTIYIVSLGDVLALSALPVIKPAFKRKFPAWLIKAIKQAQAAADVHGRKPLVVIHAARTSIKDAVCLTW